MSLETHMLTNISYFGNNPQPKGNHPQRWNVWIWKGLLFFIISRRQKWRFSKFKKKSPRGWLVKYNMHSDGQTKNGTGSVTLSINASLWLKIKARSIIAALLQSSENPRMRIRCHLATISSTASTLQSRAMEWNEM